MQNLTNYHSHCSFCDGKAPLEDFVKSAIAAGFTAYGVSSHAPLPFETRWTLSADRVPDYLQEAQRLKEKYAEKIELYTGMEIDYLNDSQQPAIPYFQELPLDYRIGSVHLVYTDEGEVIDTDTNTENFKLLLDQHFGGDLEKIIKLYYRASMQMVEAGGFDFIGHADKIAYNANYCRAGVTETTWYKSLKNDLFALIAEKGIMLEMNTKVYSKRACFFPGQECLSLVRQLGIPVVVNSDTHLPEMVNSGRPEALKALKAAGFRTVMELHGGKWQEVEIGKQ